jgi:hypothetical protein
MNEHESEFGGVGNRGLPHGFGEQEAYLSGSSTVSSPTKLEVQYGRVRRFGFVWIRYTG